jgi:DNA topoisomerase-1
MDAQEGQSEEEARRCPACGGRLGLKLAKSGGFIGCGSYPACTYARPLALLAAGEDAPPSDGVQPLQLQRRCFPVPFKPDA